MSNSMEYPKRLIEVDLPIKRISAHARREKDMRKCHVPMLYIWPATRPPAACRSILCSALWPDPADPLCPLSFREKTAEVLLRFARLIVTDRELAEGCDTGTFGRWMALSKEEHLDPANPEHQVAMRWLLLDLIADFANWDNSTKPTYLEAVRTLTQVAHESLGGITGTRPLVVDPFAGGGAIPLESLRSGADAFASDLNPVAVLFNKIILEYIPKHGELMIKCVKEWGEWAQKRAYTILTEFYPNQKDGAIPVAYLWARTVVCEGPGCGAEVPLLRSLWLARKGKRASAIRIIPTQDKHIEIDVIEDVNPDTIGPGTVRRNAATCPCCGYTTPPTSVKRQLRSRHGGAADARMYAVVVDTTEGRHFRKPTEDDRAGFEKAKIEYEKLSQLSENGLSVIPCEPTPVGGGSGAGRAFSLHSYGITVYADLFNPRQSVAIATYAKLAREYLDYAKISDTDERNAIGAVLALIVDRLADLNASLCIWQLNTPNTAHVFSRWALPMVMDFGEVNPLAGAGGSPESAIRRMVISIGDLIRSSLPSGHVIQGSATKSLLPDDSVDAFVTDPPYYDAVPYADLSDYFYVWLKRSLPEGLSTGFVKTLTPKDDECIMDDRSGKDRAFFERMMTESLAEGRRILHPDGIGVIVFAHKSTSGWEAQLHAMVESGWTITASWPIDTEMESRLRAKNSAALASSVHLVCRPRENADGSLRTNEVGDWREVLSLLPKRIHEWMPRLAHEGVVGADAIFACLGPALEIFSRFSRVEKASGEPVTLKEYLEHVWAAVAREGMTMIFEGADATGFEEDARLTAMWLWTLKTEGNGNGNAVEEADEEDDDEEGASKPKAVGGGFALEFDAARLIAQGLGAHLEQLGNLVEVKGDTARLLPVSERTHYLFGKEEASAPASRAKKRKTQMSLSFAEELEEAENTWGEKSVPNPGATVLDRVHQAMILFAAGRAEAMKRFLVEEGAGNDPRFWRLAQALSSLYPTATDEKRWVDGVLARKKGMGF